MRAARAYRGCRQWTGHPAQSAAAYLPIVLHDEIQRHRPWASRGQKNCRTPRRNDRRRDRGGEGDVLRDRTADRVRRHYRESGGARGSGASVGAHEHVTLAVLRAQIVASWGLQTRGRREVIIGAPADEQPVPVVGYE